MTITEALRKLLPPDRCLVDKAALAAYASDGVTAFHVVPLAVVLVESHQEVVEVVSLCHLHHVPFVARGSGTSLSGGSVPIENGVVIAMNRMNRIIKVDLEACLAVVEPGVTNLSVTKAVQPFGLHYAPDPSSQQVCTLGGNVAFNSGGAHCLKYGMTSNHILGMKVVLPDGTVSELGGPFAEGVGPDVTGMFCGTEGLMGIATEIYLRLLPRAERYHTILVGYQTLEQAGDAVAAVVESGLLPGAMEIMDRLAMDAAEAAVQSDFPAGSEACLIVELEGPAEQVTAEVPKLESILRRSDSVEVRIAKDAEDRMRIWKGRKSAFSAVGRLSPDFIVQDGVVPRRRLGQALRRIDELSKACGLRVANVFHAGDGNLHPLILYDGRNQGELERAEALAGKILLMCVEMGGSITGEHGVGLEKRDYLPAMFDSSSMQLMRDIRSAVDPSELSNQGKMFPVTGAPALVMRGLHPMEKTGLISRE
ncbi:MAG: FAD-binding protein [Verrucomicrobiaceae bacterium]|nr:FAD-binding protein [Verrucomicrobiaceae bacterium]